MLRITGAQRPIGRRIGITHSIWLGPAGANSAEDDVDLVVGQHPSGVLRKRRHACSGNSIGGYATHRGIVGNGEVNGIAKSDRDAALSIWAVASSAVGCVEEIEVYNLAGRDHLRILWRAPTRAVANAARHSG
jgi:hypothetical protein